MNRFDTSRTPSAHHQRTPHYDVVIVGARVAGAATAVHLAKAGLRVLVIDKAAYGSDTLSTHALMRGAVTQLERLGVLEQLRRRSPAITETVFRYGEHHVSVDVTREGAAAPLVAPRRTVLDRALADAALEAGAKVLFETRLVEIERDRRGTVRGIVFEASSGARIGVTTDLLVGADGLRSTVARQLDVPLTRRGQAMSANIMRYVSDADLPTHAYQWLWGPERGAGVIPSSDGQLVIFTAVPPQRFRDEIRHDVEAGFHRVLAEVSPEVAEAVRAANPVGPIRSWPGHVGQFRKAFGPGWALVGDAGYFKDPYAAHGISDALRDAELLSAGILEGDLAGYEATRDRLSMPLFETLERIAGYHWTLETLPGLHLQLSKAMSAELAELDALRSARSSRLAA